jgi:hypothetical protein
VKATVDLSNGTTLHIRQAVIAGSLMKYSYHWSDQSGAMIRRWDNSDHWPNVKTKPHHCHVGAERAVTKSPEAGDLDAVMARIVHLCSEEK